MRKYTPPRGSFERKLLLVLVAFSLIPSLLLLGLSARAIAEAVTLNGSLVAWERVAESGRVLVEEAERADLPELSRAARAHREELSASLVQSRRWEYVLQRALRAIPLLALLLGVVVVALAVRSARRMARSLSRPIRELVRWSEQVARGEPLPPAARSEKGEFGALRNAFRTMSEEIRTSRARELETERNRTWMAMARRVAHELKNPLTPMRLAVRALYSEVGENERTREALEVLAAESARLEELARAFAEFGRLPEGPPSDVDLRELLQYLLRTHLPPGVRGELEIAPDLPLVPGHHDALSRAFANLLLNAVDALGGEEGTVTVAARVVENAIEVSVADTGTGIAAEHRERIWEPDFTTKSRGTGLGLVLVRQTVQAHAGEIRVESREEGGAEFRIRLPLAGAAAIPA